MRYSIGQVAKKLGLTAHTLRYYDKEGLLPFVRKGSSGARVFEDEDVDWLIIIECLKGTGMQLKDIKKYMDLCQQGDATVGERLGLFKRQKEKLEQLNVYQNRQLKLMHQMDEELRIQRHDFQQHISMLAFMNSQGEKEKLTAYLNEMQEGELFQTKFERTDNFVIDSILSYKLQESDRLGIETKMDVKVPKDLNVSAYVLTGILTNLLDNAIEACEKVQDKKIKITIKYAKKMLIIRISNTYDGKEKFNSVMGIKTSKKDKELHGYGIKSIRHMVESVDGDFEIHTKEEWFVADVVIPLV